jgi:hypothetical protein
MALTENIPRGNLNENQTNQIAQQQQAQLEKREVYR